VDPLLQRGEELAALESVVAAARDGRGQLVLVAGEAGIGKASLVRALRERLSDRAAFLLGALHARAPAVAVLEDAHWADPATADVLRLLTRRVEDAGVVVIVTYRDDELAVNAALAMLVGDLVTSPAARSSGVCALVHKPRVFRHTYAAAGVGGLDWESL
jgi:predicted ATPase